MMSRDSWSKEVMVRIWIDGEDGISDIESFCYEMCPIDKASQSDKEWVLEHMQNCLNAEIIKDLLGIKEDGVFQILMKCKIHGWWSGWEIEEYDEDLEPIEYTVQKMPDDWFAVGTSND